MADTSRRLAGTATVTVDGRSYLLVGELAYRTARVQRETLTGQDRVHGYAERPIAGFISGTFRDVADLTVADFNAMTDATVCAQLANGKMVIGTNMWTVEAQEVKTAEGTFDVRWEGDLVEEA